MPFCLEQARIKPRVHRQIIALDIRTITGGIGARAERGDMELLKRSIARLGLVSPLLVRARGEGYEIIAGARRLSACRALGMKRVECVIMPALDEEAMLAALGENACRAAPLAQDVAAARDALIARHGYSSEELDELCGADSAERANECGGALKKRAVTVRSPGGADNERQRTDGALPPHGIQADEDLIPRRRARGYIRDERLIVNALGDVVDKLRGAGIKAHIDVEHMDDALCVQVVFPDAHAENHTKITHQKGEHSVEFCNFASDNVHGSHVKIEKQCKHTCEHALRISDAGQEIAGADMQKNAPHDKNTPRVFEDASASLSEKTPGSATDMRYAVNCADKAAAPTEEYFMQMLRDEMKRGISAAPRAYYDAGQ